MARILGTDVRLFPVAPSASGMTSAFAAQTMLERASTSRLRDNMLSSRVVTFDTSQLRRLAPSRRGCFAAASAPKQPDQRGSELQWATQLPEKYRLGKVIGTGAFGTVRLARSKDTSETVAVKVLSKSRPGQSRQRTAGKLLREAQCMAVVQECDGVVALKGLFEDMNSAYFVMDHCTGGDLEQLVQNHGRLTEHQAAVVLFEVLLMIAACHRCKVCHGDIKPANFLMSKRLSQGIHQLRPGDRGPDPGWLKAIDFGCAQQVVGNKPLSRRTGTPVYMAPEVFVRKYSCPADMWSCGMLMYHLLSARFPFWDNMQQCKASSLEEVMDAVTKGDIVTNIAPFTTMSPEGKSLLGSLLVRDPSKRLSAEAALDHPYFKVHLGWQAEEPRLLQEALPALVTAWHNGESAKPRGKVHPESSRTIAEIPDDVIYLPKNIPSGDVPIAFPLPIVANNVVEYHGHVASRGSSRTGRVGNPGQQAGIKANRGSGQTQTVRRLQTPQPTDRRRHHSELQLACSSEQG